MNKLARTMAVAATLTAVTTTVATAQRSRGTMGVPRTVTPRPAAPPSASSRGTTAPPRRPYAASPRSSSLPRLVTEPPRRPGSGYAFGSSAGGGRSYGGGRGYDDRRPRYSRPPTRRWGVTSGCVYGCVRFGAGIRSSRFFSSFFIGYPFAVPVYLPYVYESSYVRYAEPVVDGYTVEAEREPERAASRLIVIGGGTGSGGDALTVETLGDSVRLSWLAAGRSAREVKLFVADSARQELASRSASPLAPHATFEVATLSAPVAFVGVSVTFVDGVSSTTVVPYRGTTAGPRR